MNTKNQFLLHSDESDSQSPMGLMDRVFANQFRVKCYEHLLNMLLSANPMTEF